MRILIIGGTGFIGPHIVQRLVGRGHDVIALNRGQTKADLPPEVLHLLGDRERLVEYRPQLERFAPEVVVDTRPMTERQARILMAAIRGIAGRVVVLSSGDVYRAYGLLRGLEVGPPLPVLIAEDAPLRQHLFPYRGATPRAPEDPECWLDDYEKILVEQAVMGEANPPATILRLPMVYGPGDDAHRLFPYLKRVDDGRPAIVLEELHGRWLWARGYVEDIAEAVVLAALDDRAAGRVYNVGETDTLTEAEWVREIGRAAGWPGKVLTVAADCLPERMRLPLNFEHHLSYDTTRIRAELGYREGLPRAEALGRTIRWERAHPPDHLDPNDFDYAAEDAALERIAQTQ
jgi:nucleoside-diphosphate-sugar epimerase